MSPPEFEPLTVPVLPRTPVVPDEWFLDQNYPNPFNARTVISFGLPVDSWVRLDVYNILGQRVTTLKDEFLTAGHHNATWNDDRAPSGVYFYRLQTEEFTEANDAAMERIEQAVRRELGRFEDLFLVDVHFRIKDEPWRLLVEVVGPQTMTPADLTEIKKTVIKKTGRQLDIQVWFRNEVVVTEEGYRAYEEFIKEPLRENQKIILDRRSQLER